MAENKKTYEKTLSPEAVQAFSQKFRETLTDPTLDPKYNNSEFIEFLVERVKESKNNVSEYKHVVKNLPEMYNEYISIEKAKETLEKMSFILQERCEKYMTWRYRESYLKFLFEEITSDPPNPNITEKWFAEKGPAEPLLWREFLIKYNKENGKDKDSKMKSGLDKIEKEPEQLSKAQAPQNNHPVLPEKESQFEIKEIKNHEEEEEEEEEEGSHQITKQSSFCNFEKNQTYFDKIEFLTDNRFEAEFQKDTITVFKKTNDLGFFRKKIVFKRGERIELQEDGEGTTHFDRKQRKTIDSLMEKGDYKEVLEFWLETIEENGRKSKEECWELDDCLDLNSLNYN